jgi:D-serine deaminase-like pyridoxal phosphate-dependent protein
MSRFVYLTINIAFSLVVPPPSEYYLTERGKALPLILAKISEAEVMADAGLEDIFIAYPLVTDTKIRRAIRLARRLNNLTIGVDSLEGARRLSASATAEGRVVRWNRRIYEKDSNG